MTETQQTIQKLIAGRCANGPISYRDYIDLVLYSKPDGYYQQQRTRVGRHKERDFYTAESLGSVFSRMVVSAAEDLLPNGDAREHEFIEIAAEPGSSLIDAAPENPFKKHSTIRLGDQIEANGPVIVFANEWLDALPFHRLVFRDGQWRERGVHFVDGELAETVLDELSPSVAAQIDRLPSDIEDGYEFDWPLEAESALEQLLAQDWTGLLLLFDYGKTWQALMQDCPSGTARTYYRHEQGNDLLATPGERDITCDVCWTALEGILKQNRFTQICLESQESFLVKRAERAAQDIISNSAGQFSTDRQTLMQLIHPANMGQRFQVLWGSREA